MASVSTTLRHLRRLPALPGSLDRLANVRSLVDDATHRELPSRVMSLPFLGVVRRSRHQGGIEDESTSVPYQRRVLKEEAAYQGGHIAGWAVDLNVSAGKVMCFDRPELGPWMTERAHEYQGLIVLRGDRILRSSRDLHPLCEWAVQERKKIIFVKGPGDSGRMVLDFSRGPLDPISQLILTLNTFYSELEWWTKKERNTETAAYLASVGRWGGGPYSYQLMPQKADQGWTLVLNPDTEDVAREMVDLALRGRSLNSIARTLNDKEILTPTDYKLDQAGKIPFAKISGTIAIDGDLARIEPAEEDDKPEVIERPKRGAKWAVKSGQEVIAGQRLTERGLWNASSVGVILRSQSLIGQRNFNGKIVLDDKGKPVIRAEALIDLETFHKLQDELAKSTRQSKGFKSNVLSLAAQFAFCPVCGSGIYHRNRQGYRYYRCSDAWGYNQKTTDAPRCPVKSMKAEVVENVISNLFLATVGDLDVITYERVKPNDNREYIREAKKALQQTLAERAEKPEILWDAYDETIKMLETRILDLAQETSLEVKVIERRTGEKYRDLWFGSDLEERRELLRTSGARFELTPAGQEGMSFGRFERPVEANAAVQIGSEDGIAYAFFLGDDLAKRVTGRDLTATYQEQKVLDVAS